MTPHPEPDEPSWPADGSPSWAPQLRWVVLLLVAFFLSIVWLWMASPMTLSDGHNF